MTFVAYIDQIEPLLLDDAKLHCRVDGYDEDALFSDVIIPGARALAEQKTGCAIRNARYTDTISDAGETALSVGGVTTIESVTLSGNSVAYTTRIQSRRTFVTAPAGSLVTYTAGTDIQKHPGVKLWMLLVCAWMYANRELIGDSKAEPPYFIESLLSSISVPTGF